MTHTVKLLPILLLGSALSGCSMAGAGDLFSQNYTPTQDWGGSSYCGEQPSQAVVQQPTCGNTYSAAPVQAVSQPYAQTASQTYSQPYSQVAAAPVAQSYTQPAQNTYYTDQNAYYTGQNTYQGAQSYPVQQGYSQTGYGSAPYVHAQGGASRGLRQSYTYGTLGATLYDVDSDLYGIQGRLGWQSKSFFGAEVEGSIGISDDESFVDFGNGFIEAESEIDTQIAAFAVGRYPVSNKVNLLGRVGYHRTELSAEFDDGVNPLETEFSTDGIAYGAGVEYAFNPTTALRADYTRYDFDGPEADAISLAVARKF